MDSIDENSTCRTCLNNEGELNIFTSHILNETNLDYCCKVMMDLFSVSACKEDGLPIKICRKCSDALASAYKFKQLVEKSYRQLLLLTYSDSIKLENIIKNEIVDEGESSGLEDDSDMNMGEVDMDDSKLLMDETCISGLLPDSGSDLNTNLFQNKELEHNPDFEIPLVLKLESDIIKTESENLLVGLKEEENIKLNVKHHSMSKKKSTHRKREMKPIHMSSGKINAGALKKDKKISISCHYCQKVCLSKNSMIRHLMIHTGEKPYLCPECGLKFRQVSHLKSHIDSIHNLKTRSSNKTEMPEAFACSFCPKMFHLKNKLVDHERTHTREKPYSCEYCDYRFAYRFPLECHMRTHTGETPFNCEICSKGFGYKGALIVHKRIHTGERPFCCDICPKRFTQKSALKNHMNVHTGGNVYTCEFCSTAFPSKFNLNRHKKTHAECKKKFEKLTAGKQEEPIELEFSCNVCDKKFSEGSDLENHVRNHKRTYFSCDVCNIKFSKKRKLDLHMSTHISDNCPN